MDKRFLGKMIKKARLKKSLTQQQLSEKVDITVVYLSELERGLKLPSFILFIELARALDVSADYLLIGELETAKSYLYDDLTDKLEGLTLKQRIACVELIETYIRNL